MKHAAPPQALSLQGKLDRIAHDRAVLDLQRDLLRRGLREGDLVRRVADGARGRLAISRAADRPQLFVEASDGTRADYCAAMWQPERKNEFPATG